MSKLILVTGFEPFGGEAVNPSALVAQALHGRTIDGVLQVPASMPRKYPEPISPICAWLNPKALPTSRRALRVVGACKACKASFATRLIQRGTSARQLSR